MIDDLPATWGALCALVLALGLRHGLDADHLAAVDALTRMQLQAARRGARWCGAWFALGHGAVVLLVALLVSQWAATARVPAWLDATGTALSAACLLLLGLANLRQLLLVPAGQAPAPAGLRTGLTRWARQPAAAAGVGALFAVSFDTLSQAALFGLAGARFSGLGSALALAAVFAAGMLLVDACNGCWVARLLARPHAGAVALARALGWAVTALSLGVAALGLVRLGWP